MSMSAGYSHLGLLLEERRGRVGKVRVVELKWAMRGDALGTERESIA
jgi:hypothetical protein